MHCRLPAGIANNDIYELEERQSCLELNASTQTPPRMITFGLSMLLFQLASFIPLRRLGQL
jgi:hypothetical protein